MASLRKLGTKLKILPDKEKERKKIVRRSRSLSEIHYHPRYFGETPLRTEIILAPVPLNRNDHHRRNNQYQDHHPTQEYKRPSEWTSTKSTKPLAVSRPFVHPGSQPTKKMTAPARTSNLDKPQPPLPNRSGPPKPAARKIERAVPVPGISNVASSSSVNGYYRTKDILAQFPAPPLFINRTVQRLEGSSYFTADDNTWITNVAVEMPEYDSDPFRMEVPAFATRAASSSTPNLLRSASMNSKPRQIIPESYAGLGTWSATVERHPPSPRTLMQHNNMSSKSLAYLMKDGPARQPVLHANLAHKESPSFATPRYWPEQTPMVTRLTSAPPRVEALSRSNSRNVPRLGDNKTQHRQDHDCMKSTASTRSIESNISALRKAKKLKLPPLSASPLPPLKTELQTSNMLSSGSTRSTWSLFDRSRGPGMSPGKVEPKPSRNVLKKVARRPQEASSSNMLSTGSARSMFSPRSRLVPESEKKTRPQISVPTSLQPYSKRR